MLAKQCPAINGVQTYADNATQKCVYSCSNSLYPDATTLRCSSSCPTGSFGDNSTGQYVCVNTCPGINRFRDNSTYTCVTVCPVNTFGDTLSGTCVYTCPSGYYALADANRLCTSDCGTGGVGWWGNSFTRTCIQNPVTGCPPNTWADNSTNKCEKTCSSNAGYYG